MAIEDGAALAALLPAGTAASQIPAQLRLWQECRRSRVEHILGFSIRNGRDPGNPEFPRPSCKTTTNQLLSHTTVRIILTRLQYSRRSSEVPTLLYDT